MAAAAAAAEIRETPTVTPRRMARTLDGRTPLTEDDELLEAPEVYYHPQQPDLSYRIIPGQYPLPHFTAGREVVYTRVQRETVRRLLGSNADRWQGDSPHISEDLTCDHPGCRFVTRNWNAFLDHRKYFGHMGG